MAPREKPAADRSHEWAHAREYRCPVCGHVDEAEVRDEAASTFRCTHCSTLLVARLASADSERLDVQVAREAL